MASKFSIGIRVQTHSLTTAEYNDLKGSVTGPAVEKNGVTRVPVKLRLSDGTEKTTLIKTISLTLSPHKYQHERKLVMQLMVDEKDGAVRKDVEVDAANVNDQRCQDEFSRSGSGSESSICSRRTNSVRC
mmetsp:Transcript_16002/g.26837  ORF Transcript_16002/g.26837 Transcript_16002/m.26837 type:complete len:130 (+) Transcript_16002:236-625(+)